MKYILLPDQVVSDSEIFWLWKEVRLTENKRKAQGEIFNKNMCVTVLCNPANVVGVL